jgi:hypothetical protein
VPEPKPGELQAAADDPKFVVTGIASAYLLWAMKIKSLPAEFAIPGQPFKTAGRRRLGPRNQT